MFLICWRMSVFNFGTNCPVWGAALHVIRDRVSESSTEEELKRCREWIDIQSERHWRIHLRSWLRYIERGKKENNKDEMEKLEVKNVLEKFYKQ